jgi:glutamate-1-semialdehyde 2,1-aminomutase
MAEKAGTSSFRAFVDGIMKQKQIDHEASHSNLINQFLHLISSSVFLYCYAIFFTAYREAVYLGIASLVLRQSGHYIFEPPCHEKEQAMLGFDTQNKVKIVIAYFVLPTLFLGGLTQIEAVQNLIVNYDVQVADLWIFATFVIVFGRVFLLWSRFGFIVSQHWFIKFITDPFTDIPAYWRSSYQILNPKLLKYALHRSFPNYIGVPSNMSEDEIRAIEHGNGFPGVKVTAEDIAAAKSMV